MVPSRAGALSSFDSAMRELASARISTLSGHPTCERLFAYRGQQSWPPVVEVGTNWESLYAAAAEGLAVIQDVRDAVEWANRLIEEIAK
jgi:hypothetical protein